MITTKTENGNLTVLKCTDDKDCSGCQYFEDCELKYGRMRVDIFYQIVQSVNKLCKKFKNKLYENKKY